MQSFGQRGSALIPARGGWPWALAGMGLAAVSALWMWGFTVDDALISVRYARHLARGMGWRFNAGGPSTDGVTPLPWPALLAPFAARGDALSVLFRARVLGLVSWVIAAAALGMAVGHTAGLRRSARAAVLTTLALPVPLAAYASSGMETPIAASLATLASVSWRRPLMAAIFAGLAGAMRPEMVPWAIVLAAGFSVYAKISVGRATLASAIASLPFLVCAAIRTVAWGRPAPLALWAKPSDLAHGSAYALAAIVVSVVPILVFARRSLSRSPPAIAIVVAAVVHGAVLVLVGGDWMPYARLAVPVIPSLVYAGALVAAHASGAATAARCSAAMALGCWFLVRNGNDGRHVTVDRERLVDTARPWLAPLKRVAALDIGWVGAATSADIIDLAGVTDPVVAMLPGGHTSKRVGPMFLLGRDPDALLLYSSAGPPDRDYSRWREAVYPRVVEQRLATDEVIARHFSPATWLPLGTSGAGYLLLVKAR